MLHVFLTLMMLLGGGGPQTGTGTSDLRVQVVRSPEDGSVLGGVAMAGDVVLSLERVAVEHLLTTQGDDGSYAPGGSPGTAPPPTVSTPVYNAISQSFETVKTTAGPNEKPEDLARRHDSYVEARINRQVEWCQEHGHNYWEEKREYERQQRGPDDQQ